MTAGDAARTTEGTRERPLRVNEIFLSLQGETSRVGLPTAFIRLTGCPLRCSYCDTPYAFHEGSPMSIREIVAAIRPYGTRFVTVTGGEPLAQKGCHDLLLRLCDEGFDVSLETSGAIDIGTVDARVVRIVDFKTPASGESHRNRLENIRCLGARDQAKFVICDREDYDWCRAFMTEHGLAAKCEVLFSPSHAEMNATTLAEWVLADALPVRFQVQLHKYLWGDARGR